jgi:hypothetical protein
MEFYNASGSSDDRRTSLLGGDSLAQSATNVLSKVLSNVGINNEAPYGVDESETLCSICWEVMDEEEGNLFTITSCSHTYHKHCIARWKETSRKCPCCRGPLPDEIGPTLSRLRTLPAEEVFPEMTVYAVFWNVIFSAVGICYPLFLVALFLAFGTILFGMVVIIIFLMAIFFSFEDDDNNIISGACMSMVVCIMFPLLICFLLFVFIALIFYVLFRTLKFYANVFTCKMRWSSAYSYIIGRTRTVSGYLFAMLE